MCTRDWPVDAGRPERGRLPAVAVAMFPILLVMYARLSVKEEAEMRKRFGSDCDVYTEATPRFIPWMSTERRTTHQSAEDHP